MQRNNRSKGRLFYERGQLYQKIGQFHKAIDDYSEAIRLLPQDGQALGDAFGGRAGICQEIGQHQKAIDDYSEAIDISAGFGRYERTVSEVRRDGPPYNWLYGRARSHAWIGEYLRAKVYYTMAIDVRPDSYDSYLGMGWCYEQEGNLEKAAEYNAKANALRRRR